MKNNFEKGEIRKISEIASWRNKNINKILKKHKVKKIIEFRCENEEIKNQNIQDIDTTRINISEIEIKKYLKSHTGYNWDFVLFHDIGKCIECYSEIFSLLRAGQKLVLFVSKYIEDINYEYSKIESKIKGKFDSLIQIISISIIDLKEKFVSIIIEAKTKNERLEYIRKIVSTNKEGMKTPFIHPTSVVNKKFVNIGERVMIMPNVVVGFPSIGAVWDENGIIVRFPQDGKVKIGNDVFIGSCAVIDRAANEENVTEIGDRCVIGPMAHIGHNVIIGHDSMVLGNTIICGGAKIGNRCMLGANSTIKHKITIGNGVVVGMGSVVTKNVPNGVLVAGNPARILGNNFRK